jgi:hypothetical protein
MRCIPTEERCSILQDIHSGVCGSHAGARTLVGKAYKQEFYWPMTVADTNSLVHHCEGFQYFACQKHVPASQLHTISIT